MMEDDATYEDGKGGVVEWQGGWVDGWVVVVVAAVAGMDWRWANAELLMDDGRLLKKKTRKKKTTTGIQPSHGSIDIHSTTNPSSIVSSAAAANTEPGDMANSIIAIA